MFECYENGNPLWSFFPYVRMFQVYMSKSQWGQSLEKTFLQSIIPFS